MSRQLLLLRHGKSDWDVEVSDYDRPLKKRGKRAAQKMGCWLQHKNLIPDYILSSPAKRAKITAKKLTKAMGLKAQKVHFITELYATEFSDLLNILATCPTNAQRVLIIGHNPELEALLLFLDKKNIPIPVNGKLLPTAALAMFNMPDDWTALKKNSGELVLLMHPSELTARRAEKR